MRTLPGQEIPLGGGLRGCENFRMGASRERQRPELCGDLQSLTLPARLILHNLSANRSQFRYNMSVKRRELVTIYSLHRGRSFGMDLSIIADEGDTIRVRCEGEITNAFYEGTSDEPLANLLGGPDGLKRKVLLNLERVRYLDSSGISWLLIHHKHTKERGGKFVLYEVPPLILQTLEFLKLSHILHIASDEAGGRLAGGDKP